MLLEWLGGSVAGNVIPPPAVCLLRNGGLLEVGEVTVVVVNREPVDAVGGGRESEALDVAFDF